MHAKVNVKLLVFVTFLANYTHLLKTKNCDERNKHFEHFEGSRPSKYSGVILKLILVKSFQCFRYQRPNNNKNQKYIKFNLLDFNNCTGRVYCNQLIKFDLYSTGSLLTKPKLPLPLKINRAHMQVPPDRFHEL